jgi:hypothetical protein
MNKPLPVAANNLRQRLIEDMNLRGFPVKTRHGFLFKPSAE